MRLDGFFAGECRGICALLCLEEDRCRMELDRFHRFSAFFRTAGERHHISEGPFLVSRRLFTVSGGPFLVSREPVLSSKGLFFVRLKRLPTCKRCGSEGCDNWDW